MSFTGGLSMKLQEIIRFCYLPVIESITGFTSLISSITGKLLLNFED